MNSNFDANSCLLGVRSKPFLVSNSFFAAARTMGAASAGANVQNSAMVAWIPTSLTVKIELDLVFSFDSDMVGVVVVEIRSQ